MPVTIKRVKGGFSVSTPNMIHARKTTKAKAKKQERLLNAVEHGWEPTKRKKK